MNEDNIELVAKLKLDTSDAEKQLESLSSATTKAKTSNKKVTAELPKDTKLELPKSVSQQLKDLFSGDKGIENIGKVAKDSMGGIEGLTNSLTGMLPVLGWIAAAVAAVVKLLEGTDTMQAMSSSFNQLFNTLRTTLAPVLSAIGEVFIELAGIVTDLLPILEPVVDLLRTALLPVIAALKALEPVVELFSKLFEVISAFSSIFTDTLFGIIESILAVFVELVNVALKPLITLLEPVVEFFNNLKQTIQDFITTITGGLITFDNALTSTTGTKADYNSSLDTWSTSGTGAVYENKQLEETKRTNTLLEWLGTVFVEVGNFISSTVTFVGNIIKSIIDGIKSSLDWIANAYAWVRDNIFSPLWEGIKSIVSWTVDFFKNIGNAIIEAIKSVFNFVTDTGSNIFSGVTADKSAGFGGGLFTDQGRWGDGYQFGDITGSVIDFGAGLIGKGWLWEDGGTLDVGAQIWGMNEKGNPEFLFNAGGHDTVINAEILQGAMYSAMVDALKAMPTKVEVKVKEGGDANQRALANWLLPMLKFNMGK